MLELEVAQGVITHSRRSERPRILIDGIAFPLPERARILPGFVDSHCHLIGLGMMAERVPLHGLGSAEECAERVAQQAGRLEKGNWILGFGWNQELWKGVGWPDRSILDAVVPDHPVILHRVDTHASWVNSLALRLAEIRPMDVPGGRIVLDDRGEPTGLLIDRATSLVERVMPVPTTEQKSAWIAASVQDCVRLGITEIHDMNVEPERLEAMTRVADGGELLLRCRLFLSGMNDEWRVVPRPSVLAPNLDTVGVKFFADGALGSRGALLLEEYSDAPTRGLQLIARDDLVERAAPALQAGYGVATHAIGDGANRLVLDAYQQLRSLYPEGLLRIEHAQIVHLDDLHRFAELNVIPSVQPVHCVSDAAMAVTRLGPARCRTAYRWRSLLETGVPLIGGSDFPIESPDPRVGIAAFIDRRAVGSTHPWYPDETIDPDSAVRAYTEWAQRGVPGRSPRGRLEPGYDADIVVVDGDPLDGGEIVATFVGGVPVYRRDHS